MGRFRSVPQPSLETNVMDFVLTVLPQLKASDPKDNGIFPFVPSKYWILFLESHEDVGQYHDKDLTLLFIGEFAVAFVINCNPLYMSRKLPRVWPSNVRSSQRQVLRISKGPAGDSVFLHLWVAGLLGNKLCFLGIDLKTLHSFTKSYSSYCYLA